MLNPVSTVTLSVLLGAVAAAGAGSCSLEAPLSEERKTATLEASAFEATKAGFLTQSILSIAVKPAWTTGSAKLKLQAIPKDAQGAVKLCSDRTCANSSDLHTVDPATSFTSVRYIANDLVGGSVTFRSAPDSEVEAAPVTVDLVSGELTFEDLGSASRPNSTCRFVRLTHLFPYPAGEPFGIFTLPATFLLTFLSSSPRDGDGFYSNADCTAPMSEASTMLKAEEVGNATPGIQLYVKGAPGATLSLRAEADGWNSKTSEITLAQDGR